MTTVIIIMFAVIAFLIIVIIYLCLEMLSLHEGYARQLQAIIEQNTEILERMKKRLKYISEIMKDVNKIAKK